MPNAKDYTGGERKFLLYGLTGAGKTCASLTFPGKKMYYIFDPAGLESLAGHDVDYEIFIPEMTIKKSALGKGSRAVDMIRPDPQAYPKFEEVLEGHIDDGYLDRYDVIVFDSITTLMSMMMNYILDAQGRGNAAPEIQDYYFRSDGMQNLIRVMSSQRDKTIIFTAHTVTAQDKVTERIETVMYLPDALKVNLPLLFSEVLYLSVESTRDGSLQYFTQTVPSRRVPTVRSSLRGVKPQEDITIDWNKPVEGQGLSGLYERSKTVNERVVVDASGSKEE